MSRLVEAFRGATYYDVSPVLDARWPVFPGHPPIRVNASARTHADDGYFLQQLTFGEHVGSHVDAPAHAVAELADRTIDRYPVSRFIAPYVKYDLSSLELKPGDLVDAAALRNVEARDGVAAGTGDVAILQFGWDRHLRAESDIETERTWWIRNAPGLAADACALLADRGVRGVGSDTATGDSAVRDGEIVSDAGHTVYFLPREILLFEGLIGLAAAPPCGLFIGLPLRIAGGSGSPIRAVLVAEASP